MMGYLLMQPQITKVIQLSPQVFFQCKGALNQNYSYSSCYFLLILDLNLALTAYLILLFLYLAEQKNSAAQSS